MRHKIQQGISQSKYLISERSNKRFYQDRSQKEQNFMGSQSYEHRFG
ncbi:Uncharacterized protein dnm_018740 [Desulfonema magnum]|uniref:Uncharacterized protein n=1 Tax=Desulfonema magnum TaxID=45655 RepID=A0A975GLP9_9BACT|nr:Uncharacterized protein dnm_018740 [Desulfonema magnum]